MVCFFASSLFHVHTLHTTSYIIMSTCSLRYLLLTCSTTLLATMACQDTEPLDTSTDMGMDQGALQDSPKDLEPDFVTDTRDMSTPDQQDRLDMPRPTTVDMPPDARPDLDMPIDMTPRPSRTYLYVGGGSYQGGPGFITRHLLDTTSGQFEDRQELLSRGGNLSYMTIDAQRALLHAIDELSNDVYTVALDAQTGLLTSAPTRIDARCHGVHITLDESGDQAIVSCYREGKTSLLALDASAQALSWQDTVDSGAKTHQAVMSPDGQHVFVVSLESQHVVRFDIETGKLVSPMYTSIPGRIGPRHMAFHPTEPRAYILGESKPTLITARYSEQGTLDELDSTSLDEGRESFDTAGSAIRVHPSGRWVLSAQRFQDERDGRIVVTELDAQGHPTERISHSSSMGKSPRDLVISEDGKLVAVSNRRSRSVAIFDFDAQSGALTFVQELDQPNQPFTVYFWHVLER